MSAEKPDRVVLSGDAAMKLWHDGQERWNLWVADQPEADIDFSNQHFAPNANEAGDPEISFEGFQFPAGYVDFSDATFGEGDVDFFGATFDKGDVNFSNATFGEGDVDFSDATFGEGDVNFSGATFGEGDVNFYNATFGKGNINFLGATFGKGDVDFFGATFGEGDVDFFGATFDKGDVDFSGATFGEGDVNFSNATFGEGDVNFSRATFGEGDVDFSDATFGEGDVNFSGATFGKGKVQYENTAFGVGSLRFDHAILPARAISFRFSTFDGPAHFRELQRVGKAESFSFEGASFNALFIFSHKGKMGCPLDLRRTKMTHDVVVNDIQCDFDVEAMPKWASLASQYWSGMPERSAPIWRWTTKAKDREDSQRFRRLKELALSNRNHAKALEFHVQEIQSKRGHETRWWQTAAQFFFWLLGNYGRSVILPFGWMGVVLFSFAGVFWHLRVPLDQVSETYRSFSTALTYSTSNMLSFIPTGRTAKSQGEEVLFGESVPDLILAISGIQSIIAIVLLFLLGLGLRNLFRV